MPLKEKDFIEIEFTAKTKEGVIFDSNIKEDIEKFHQGHNHPIESKPFIFSLETGMFLKGVEDFLIGKPDTQAEYTIELPPEKAFGKRNPNLIQRIPIKIFKEHNLNPIPGFMFNFDGRVGKILAVSGGRVMIDFNNPVAGKIVIYYVKVLRKVTDLNEKIISFIDFLFKKDLEFSVDEKSKKLTIKAEKQAADFIKLFKDKFKEIFDLDLEVEEIEEIENKENPNK